MEIFIATTPHRGDRWRYFRTCSAPAADTETSVPRRCRSQGALWIGLGFQRRRRTTLCQTNECVGRAGQPSAATPLEDALDVALLVASGVPVGASLEKARFQRAVTVGI